MTTTSSVYALQKVKQVVCAISPWRDLSPFRIYLLALQPQFSDGFDKLLPGFFLIVRMQVTLFFFLAMGDVQGDR